MDSSTWLAITPKGEEEIQHRRHQLSIRKRSVLVSLEKPHTVEQILERTVFSEDEILDEINNLLQGGFIALDSQENARLAAQGKREEARAAWQSAIDGLGTANPLTQVVQLKLDALSGA